MELTRNVNFSDGYLPKSLVQKSLTTSVWLHGLQTVEEKWEEKKKRNLIKMKCTFSNDKKKGTHTNFSDTITQFDKTLQFKCAISKTLLWIHIIFVDQTLPEW